MINDEVFLKLFIFDLNFGISVPVAENRNEKGIRCNAGAVPAAVSPITVSESNATVPKFRDGKVQITGRARRPADFDKLFFAFGINSKSETHLIVIHFHYSTGSRSINGLIRSRWKRFVQAVNGLLSASMITSWNAGV